MKDEILLSEKHGFNPSLEVCMLCEKEIGIALLGKLKNDKKAPMKICLSNICDDCKKKLKSEKNVLIIEYNNNITGRYCIIPEDYINQDVLNENNIFMMECEQFNDLFK